MNSFGMRILAFIGMGFATLVLPWWLTLAVLITFTIYFPLYIESLVFGFVFDTLYSVQYSFPYPALASAFVFLIIVTYAKEQIRT